jgi:hypothetical protein
MISLKNKLLLNRRIENCRHVRLWAILVLIIFSLNVYIIPCVSALTVDEAAKKKSPGETTDDDFTKKVPSDRSASGTAHSGGAAGKDPRLACLLSLILPGGGQIYLKQDMKGIAFFSLTVIGYSASSYFLYRAINGDIDSSEKKSKLIISGLFFLVGAVFHVVGVVEAYNDAIEINEKNFYYGGYSRDPYIAELEIKE